MKPRSIPQAPPGTQAVTRAVTVLRTLAQASRGLGISELGAAIGVNKAAVFRLLHALEGEGMVARDAITGVYVLGPTLITLGVSALGATDLSAAAHEELISLVEQIGETATLEVLAGTEVLIIAEVQGKFLLGRVPELGTRWPAYATSTGKVLIALGAQGARAATASATLARRAPKTIASRRAFERELEKVRERGYATASDELEVGFTAIAAPVFNHLGVVVGAISINGPTARLTSTRLTALVAPLRECAERVSRRLGATSASLLESRTPVRKSKTSTRRASTGRSPSL